MQIHLQHAILARFLPYNTISTTISNAACEMLRDNFANDLSVFRWEIQGFIASNNGSSRARIGLENVQRIQLLCLAKFNELCVDVFDEVRRRHALSILHGLGNFDQLESLQPSPSMHPQRNSARQKLSTLALADFVGLCEDIMAEIERRFPSLVEQPPVLQFETEPPPRYTPVAETVPIALALTADWI
jgi:hypothetical protein